MYGSRSGGNGRGETIVVEALEGRQLLSADLAVLQINSPRPAIRVDGYNVVAQTAGVRITNEGDLPAKGTLGVDLYLSADKVLDGTDVLAGVVKERAVRLNAGKSRLFSARLIPTPTLAAGQYYLFAVAMPDGQIVQKNLANDVGIGARQVNIVTSRLPIRRHPIWYHDCYDGTIVDDSGDNGSGDVSIEEPTQSDLPPNITPAPTPPIDSGTQPTTEPTTDPTVDSGGDASSNPSNDAGGEPTTNPTTDPTTDPTTNPTTDPGSDSSGSSDSTDTGTDSGSDSGADSGSDSGSDDSGGDTSSDSGGDSSGDSGSDSADSGGGDFSGDSGDSSGGDFSSDDSSDFALATPAAPASKSSRLFSNTPIVAHSELHFATVQSHRATGSTRLLRKG